jgi:MYXO-CTERM domain-containing protein
VRGVAAGLAVLCPSSASATWSVVGVDAETREVGVAGASCIGGVDRIAGLVPDVGALAAQALLDERNRDDGVALLRAGSSPDEVIAALTDPGRDIAFQTRQYGVVTLDLDAATFTGTAAQAWAGAREGAGVTTEGNILTGPEVVDDALAAYQAEGPGGPWTLADRLLAGLEAGAARGGDGRCSFEQSALSAFLKVALPGDAAPTIDLVVPEQPAGGDNPVALLRAMYDEWRLTHPREQPVEDAGPPDAGRDPDAGADAAEGVDDVRRSDSNPGCGCRTGPMRSAGVLQGFGAAVVALLARRRRVDRPKGRRVRFAPP